MYSAIQCMLDYFMPEGAVPVLKTHPTVLIDGKTSAKYFGGAFAFHALFTVLLTKTLLPDFIPPEVFYLLHREIDPQRILPVRVGINPVKPAAGGRQKKDSGVF